MCSSQPIVNPGHLYADQPGNENVSLRPYSTSHRLDYQINVHVFQRDISRYGSLARTVFRKLKISGAGGVPAWMGPHADTTRHHVAQAILNVPEYRTGGVPHPLYGSIVRPPRSSVLTQRVHTFAMLGL